MILEHVNTPHVARAHVNTLMPRAWSPNPETLSKVVADVEHRIQDWFFREAAAESVRLAWQ
jgi:hypothetical protein